MNRKFTLLLILVVLVGLLAPAVAGAEGITDAPTPAASRYSHRLIVELTSAPLTQSSVAAEAAAGGGKLDVAAPEAQQYIQKLQAEQQAFVTAMTQAVPGAQVATYLNEQGRDLPATYQVVFNGMSVDAGRNVDLKALEQDTEQAPRRQACLPRLRARS